jgi:hypothetical protein
MALHPVRSACQRRWFALSIGCQVAQFSWRLWLSFRCRLTTSWQRRWQPRCQRWLSNGRVDVEPLFGFLIQWALHNWCESGKALHLARDIMMLWRWFGIVTASWLYPWHIW